MGYNQQTKAVMQLLEKKPEFREVLINFRRKWTQKGWYKEQIVIKGQPIADKVIRELDL